MRLSIIIIALFWFAQSFGQTNTTPSAKFQQITTSESTPEWMTLKENIHLTSEELISDKDLLRLNNDDELIEVSTVTDELGYEHQRYIQHYKGIPIEDAWYIVHSKDGHVRKANGKLVDIGKLGIEAVMTPEKALDILLANNKSQKYAWMDARVEENFKKIANDPAATFQPKGDLLITKNAEKEYVIAYRFEVFSLEPYHVEAIYIDANNGTVIKKEDLLHQAHECSAHAEEGTPATGVSNYDGVVQFTTEAHDGTYRLRNDIGQTFSAEGDNTYGLQDITDADNYWTDDPTAVDVHWGIEKAYDYFLNKHNRDSYDDNGSPVAAWVHFGNNSNIAAWNNICSCMIFGDGDGEDFNSLTSLDIVGHEYAHGVTRYTSALKYYGEAGALNESFADIFGALIEQQHGADGGDWIVGEDIVNTTGKQGLRNIANPKDPSMKRPQPDTYMGEYWYDGPMDNGGVHTNSGVHNYWFYLLANGGTGVNDNGDYYQLEGIGAEQAAQIAYHNLAYYLHPESDYHDAFIGSINAANDLFDNIVASEVYRAWCAVGFGGNCHLYMPGCRTRDSLALVDIYNSAEGNTWRFAWNLNTPISTWRGVTVNADGCVSDLDLGSRRLKGDVLSPSIGNLLDLVTLEIDNNRDFTASIPPEIGNLTHLEKAYFYFNNMTGEIPEEIGNLPNLTLLYLSDNHFTGNIPASFSNLSNLKTLGINDNKFENMPDMSAISTLNMFSVRDNYFTFEDIIPNISLLPSHRYNTQKEIGEAKTVQLTTYESYTIKLNIDTYVPDNVYNWYKDGVLVGTTDKDEFTISNFSNTDAGVYTCEVTNPNATALTLYSYPVTVQESNITCRQRDSLALVEFYHATQGHQWSTSARWNLNQPMDTWYGLAFSDEGCVTEINLVWKRLRGHLPPEIGDLLSLERLNIDRGDFSNTAIPPEIGKLVNLRYLRLYRSELSGAIPPQIGDLANLEQLDLGKNELNGSIPPELGNLTNLFSMSLFDNELTGSVPIEFSNLDALTHLILSSNELSDLPSLSHIDPIYISLTNNQFTFKDLLPNMDMILDASAGSYAPQLPVGEATTFTVSAGDEIHIDLDIDHDITDNVYEWYKDGALIETIIGSPVFQKTIENADDEGTYTCQVTNPGVSSLTLYSEAYDVQFEEMTNVYPGDFNNDGRVDGTDALFWGLTYGRTGIQRPNASMEWEPQPCINWNIAHMGVNGKHQDANGDGIVDETDLEAINANYGQSVVGEDFLIQESPISLNYEVVSSVPDGMGQVIHTINLSLINNVNDGAPIALHGLSFGFEFLSESMNYISSDITPLEPLLSDEDTLTVLRQEYPNENRAAYTITRNNLNDIAILPSIDGTPDIIQIVIIADDHQTGDPTSFNLDFSDIIASSAADASIMSLNAGSSTVMPRLEAPNIIEGISPNPTQATMGISLTLNADIDYGDGQIIITDMMGKTIKQQPIELLQGVRQIHLTTDGLPVGIYTLRLVGDGWHSQAERFIISQ